MALQHVGPLGLAHRGEIALDPMLLLDQSARLGRRIEKQDPAGRGAGALPGMRDIARHEGAGARAADRHRIADQEGDLTLQHISEFIVHDFPAGGWRFKEPAAGIYATFVNGQMLMKEGEHTGNLPGRVLRNSRYQAAHG